MCGILGIYSKDSGFDNSVIAGANKLLRHRGPDDEGFVFINSVPNAFTPFSGDDSIEEVRNKYKNIYGRDANSGNLVLCHRRLSIIDLSPNGHQPMTDDEMKLSITFNGEIYNYIELKSELEQLGYNFKTKSDTEVILKSYLQWGSDCVNHFNGMWAFALWDGNKSILFLSRDRFGVKPLYYSLSASNFIFSSEIKPIKYLLNNKVDIDEEETNKFLLYSNRPPINKTY